MSWLSDKLHEAVAQVNPFDHGQTAATVSRGLAPAPIQPPAQEQHTALRQLIQGGLVPVTPDVETRVGPQSNVSLFNGGIRFGHDPVVSFPNNEADPSIYAQLPDPTVSKQDILGQSYTGNPIYSPVMHGYKKPKLSPDYASYLGSTI